MPKKSKIKSKTVHRRTERRDSLSGDEYDDDAASIGTDVTVETNPFNEDKFDQLDIIEEKVHQLVDLATEKSANTRINALIQLKEIGLLNTPIHWGIFVDNYLSICDIIERSLKKGSENEQIAACKLASVLLIIMEDFPNSEKVHCSLNPIFVKIVKSLSVGLKAKKEAAFCLAIESFYSHFTSIESFDPARSLNILHNAFCSIIPKSQGQLPYLSPGKAAFVTAALEGMCLLITKLPPIEVFKMARGFLDEFFPVLEYEDIDLKVSVGQAIALIHEIARVHNPLFKWRGHAAVVDRLNEFVTDFSKQVAKKDSRLLRGSFRDIVSTLKDPDSAAESATEYIALSEMKFQICLDTHVLRVQYKALKSCLGKGVKTFLSHNSMLNKQFNVPSLTMLEQMSLAEKQPKKFRNDKTETKIERGRARDKKESSFASEELLTNPFAFWDS